jgi:hypothetical protein
MYIVVSPYSPSYPLSPPPTPSPMGRTSSTLLLPDFADEKREKTKRKHDILACLRKKVAIEGVSIWYFQVFMYYTLKWFISSNICILP